MPAPYIERYFPLMSPEQQLARRIDDHYHLGMIASDAKLIKEYSARAFKIQHDAAIANLRGLGEIAIRQDQTNSLLERSLSYLTGGIDGLNETSSEILYAVDFQTDVLQDGFQQIANAMLQHQVALEKISSTLSSPYETQVLELLREADRALKQGMRTSGREREAEFADATKLLKLVLDNPIGSRNYVAWFQLGWLAWKNENNFSAAEDAFYQTYRLSASTTDLYHVNGLSHLAYMRYLQNNYSEAYATILKALKVQPDDHDIRYDAARYATKVGKGGEAISLLEKCIDQQPQTIVTMFSDDDFVAIKDELAALLIRKTDESRRTVTREVARWRDAINVVENAGKEAECSIAIPPPLIEDVSKVDQEALYANHVAAVGLARHATTARIKIIRAGIQELDHGVNQKRLVYVDAERERQELLRYIEDDLRKVEYSAKSVKFANFTGWQLALALLCSFALFLYFMHLSEINPATGWINYYGLFGALFLFGGWAVFTPTIAVISYLWKKIKSERNVSLQSKKNKEFMSSTAMSNLIQGVTIAKEKLQKAESALQRLIVLDRDAPDAAEAGIEEVAADVEVGRVYHGTVLKLLDFGALVSILPGRDGLLHISQIANERVDAVADHLKEGQKLLVKVLEADEKGRVRLSMKI